MPYIKKEDRAKYDGPLDMIQSIETKGELEYCIFKLMMKYQDDKYHNYANLHDTTYAAQHCADEFRERFLNAREKSARDANGDINV